ncbi:hydroxypyruvate isomerase [Enterovibrio norvegicus]|uniref:Hydroxypyruvate isomerase n=1 Tax=Enterovibrio norvegicus TaxID=188144 RepID=A0ABV4KZ01_9GAMM|nr:hydroxypyruvate isomerase [Enterovibrio norvegicus]MCC4798576.1 hydroxypyruvate isomerase [Enterovibrio norvegicus]OEF57029.1 hydroxypyruvate isomerase [Enterovibrio norvegicus]PMI28717.1 hydroxypyruvate isomerase [Enterovibrio norvegicus]PMI36990.1 hydroxypyruvate isomerase [Enterovibrio norvegicus]PMN49500.1 hydroxypyruvate isomerase [Enterovibrio norvegicus]
MPKLTANLSMLFTELPFMARFSAADQAGFRGVEYLFPYEENALDIASELEKHQLQQVLFNLPAGDWGKGDRGIAVDPDRVEEFRQGIPVAIAYAKVLGCHQLNCLAGIVPSGVTHEAAEATFIANLQFAADALEAEGITLLIEAINTRDIPGFFLTTTTQAQHIRKAVGSPNLFIQYDIYHMQIMEGDIARTMQENVKDIRHIQLADNPGRHEPGTGEINYHYLFTCIDDMEYDGWVGCEYKPKRSTQVGLTWLNDYDVNKEQ